MNRKIYSRRGAKPYLQRLVKGAGLDSPPVAKLAWVPQCYTTESAYRHVGLWQQKRGFDSLVQSVNGIVQYTLLAWVQRTKFHDFPEQALSPPPSFHSAPFMAPLRLFF